MNGVLSPPLKWDILAVAVDGATHFYLLSLIPHIQMISHILLALVFKTITHKIWLLSSRIKCQLSFFLLIPCLTGKSAREVTTKS